MGSNVTQSDPRQVSSKKQTKNSGQGLITQGTFL